MRRPHDRSRPVRGPARCTYRRVRQRVWPSRWSWPRTPASAKAARAELDQDTDAHAFAFEADVPAEPHTLDPAHAPDHHVTDPDAHSIDVGSGDPHTVQLGAFHPGQLAITANDIDGNQDGRGGPQFAVIAIPFTGCSA